MPMTSQVTTAFLRSSPEVAASPTASLPSCLMPSEMRSFSTSTSSTLALTMSPRLYSSMTCSPGRFQSRSERWTMPSTSPSRPMNRPNSVLFLTSPSTSVPTGWLRAKASHGFSSVCLRPSEMRRLAGSTSSTTHVDFLGGRQDLAGVHVLLGPRHFGDVDQAFDARLQLDERTVVGDVGDGAGDLLADRELGCRCRPTDRSRAASCRARCGGFPG